MNEAVEQVRASLRRARDAQVARVVAVVDALPQRGEADLLIAPLRPRLAQLRPARPPGFTRVLFTPLNPVIVSNEEWRRTRVGVPRPALAPLGRAVEAQLRRDGTWQPAWTLPAEQGASLWPAAAAVLDRMSMPPDWTGATGLTAADFPTVAGAAAAVLQGAAAIQSMAAPGAVADDAALRRVLAGRTRDTAALDTVASVLLATLPSPARAVALVREVAGGERAIGQALGRLVSNLTAAARTTADLKEAAVLTARVAETLNVLGENAGPEQRAQLDAIRHETEALCHGAVRTALAQTLSLLSAAHRDGLDDDLVVGLESSARDVRRLEAAARRIGDGAGCEALRGQVALAAQTGGAALTLADRVRLVEILSGPEDALAVLRAG